MPAEPFKSYIVCTTPRSGSTMLCKMLAATGVAGAPDSHFHTPSLSRWLAVYGLEDRKFKDLPSTIKGIFEAAIDRGRGDTDIFGLRLQRGSFAFFLDQLALITPGCLTDRERIKAVFGPTLFIHLWREDRIDQAISRLIAEQSGLWHRNTDGSELERLSPQQEPRYDKEAIERQVRDLTRLDQAWIDWFSKNEIEPIQIAYETLARVPNETLEDILRRLNLDPGKANTVAPETAKLAGERNRVWKKRFLDQIT